MSSPADAAVALRLAWLRALREPGRTAEWSSSHWDHVIRVARRERLLARLAESLADAQLLDAVPAAPRRHLIAEQQLSRYRTSAMLWVLENVLAALRAGEDPVSPCVLLKGAAYMGQGLPIAKGRMPSDVDILVPKARLDAALARLRDASWAPIELSTHDQRFYREWGHEAPPMHHPLHAIELDLHHDIRPPVARVRIDIGLVLARLQPCALAGWHVLQPLDQVLHSAAHLFLDSDLRHRLRDLVDLDGMCRHFGGKEADGFFASLVDRAIELGLAQPLALAARWTTAWLDTPIPDMARERLAKYEPGRPTRLWLLPAMRATMTPLDPDLGSDPTTRSISAFSLLLRHQFGRLPLRLLLSHTAHKLWAAARDQTVR